MRVLTPDAHVYADRALGVHPTGAPSEPDAHRLWASERVLVLTAPAGQPRATEWLTPRPPAARGDLDAMIAVHMLEPARLVDEILAGYGLTKTELAETTGVSRQTVHSWLKGAGLEPDRLERLRHLLMLQRRLAGAGIDRTRLALTCPVFPGRRSAADLIRSGEWQRDRHSAELVNQMLPRAPAADGARVSGPPVLERLKRSSHVLTMSELSDDAR